MKGFAKLTGGKDLAVRTSFRQKEFKKLTDSIGSTQLNLMGERFDHVEFSRIYKAIAG